jgi:hypothetical protein
MAAEGYAQSQRWRTGMFRSLTTATTPADGSRAAAAGAQRGGRSTGRPAASQSCFPPGYSKTFV